MHDSFAMTVITISSTCFQVLYPLPSDPIRGAAPHHSKVPSLDACTPHETQQQKPQPDQRSAAALTAPIPAAMPSADTQPLRQQTQPTQSRRQPRGSVLQHQMEQHSAAADPSQADLWADLAAELRSAPISAHTSNHGRAVDDLTGSDAVAQVPDAFFGSRSAAGHAVQAKSNNKTATQDVAAGEGLQSDAQDQAQAAQSKPPRQTRRKLINSQGASEAADSSKDTTHAGRSKKPTQQKKRTQASSAAGTSKAKDAATVPSAEEEVAATTEDSDAEAPGKGDPSRQAKNAAFRGSGALGLSRRLSSRLLTPQEVKTMTKLPLPPVLHRLDRVLFPPVNGMYGFLLRQHIQVCLDAPLHSA